MNIRSFYRNKSILITGVTGFLGKILLQKILFEFPTVAHIYIIVRQKKQKSPQQRFQQDVLLSKCFDRLRQKYQNNFISYIRSKVILLEGDVQKPKLGLRQSDYIQCLKNCEIFFANAANIKFDDHLDEQIESNIDATLSTLQMAKKSNAQIFIYTSTFGVNHNRASGYIQQKIHPWKDKNGVVPDYQKLYQQLKNMSTDELRQKSSQIIENYQYPNNYQFAKGLCEHLVQKRRGSIPTVIIRPTMVYSTYKQPLPGWIDVLHAGQIIFLLTGLGVMQQFLIDPNLQVDTVPADIVVNNMLVASAFEANKDKISIYHVSSIDRNPILWSQMLSITVQFWKAYPSPKKLATPKAIISNNQFRIKLHFLWRQLWINLYTHLGPVFYPSRKKQFERLKRLNEKSIKISQIYKFGFQKFWVYQTNRVQQLKQWLQLQNRNFIVDCANINMLYYFLLNNYGIKKFILKQQVEDIPDLILESDRIQLCPNRKLKQNVQPKL